MVERCNTTIVSWIGHCVTEYRQECDSYVTPLTYAYDAQVHRSNKSIPFSFDLRRHPSGLASWKRTAMPSDVNNIDWLLAIWIPLISCTALLWKLAYEVLKMTQPGNYAFANRPLLAISTTKRMAAEGYFKLMPKRHSMYLVLIARPQMLKLLHERVGNSTGINSATRVS